MALSPIAPLPAQPAAPRQPASPAGNAQPVASVRAAVDTFNVVQPEPTAATPATQPSREQLDQAMQEMKEALPPVARNLQFSVDEDTGRTVVKVIDPATKEVIRQMPSEELLAITRALDKMNGLLIKQKA